MSKNHASLRRRSLQVESLERRELFAADVRLTFDGATYNLAGSNQRDVLVVDRDLRNRLEIVPVLGTTINGRNTAVVLEPGKSLSINLAGGDDQLGFDGRYFAIDGRAEFLDVRIATGTGNDTVTGGGFEARSLSVDARPAQSLVADFRDLKIERDFTILGSAFADAINLGKTRDESHFGTVNINAGGGDDGVSVASPKSTRFCSSLSVQAGEGRDTMALALFQAVDSLFVDLGNGDDRFINNGIVRPRRSQIVGGTGVDQFIGPSAGLAPSGFER